MELLIIVLIIAVVLSFILRKPRPSVPTPAEVREEPARPSIIEDTSHLKADLALAKQELHKAFQDMGQLQSQLKLSQSANMERTCKIMDLQQESIQQKQDYDKLLGQKKSSEVRTGHISEQLVSLLPEFPVPINTLKFFGNPIDYIAIDMDEEWVSFIEVKSGASVLSDKQKKIRKMIQDKRVRFFEVRIDEKGIKVK